MQCAMLCVLSIFVCNPSVAADSDTSFMTMVQKKQKKQNKNIACAVTLNLDNENVTDKKIEKILRKACRLEKLSAQYHVLEKPYLSSQSLTELDLSHGTLKNFPLLKHLLYMPELRTLNLAYNEISSLSSPNQQNYLHSDARYSFYTLDVSHNQLQVLDMKLLDRLDTLQQVDLSDNPLKEINHVEQSCGGLALRDRLLFASAQVDLRNTNLSSEDQELLRTEYGKLQEEGTHKVLKRSGGIIGIVAGTALGAATGGIGAGLIGTDIALFPIPLVLVLGIFIAGYPVGTRIYDCCTPDDERFMYYFVFKFNNKTTSDTLIQIDEEEDEG